MACSTPLISATPPFWSNVNNNQLPSVQIFDIKQQILDGHDCYNSGQIYVATYGRGVWTNSNFYTTPYAVGVDEEQSKPSIGNNLNLYPNPTNGKVNVIFTSVEGETASINIMDISGRLVKTENIGKLNSSEEMTFSFETSDLKSGVYLVNINSNAGVKRISKLIVTK
jgi:Secretion system C-terminal sorting domain